jgi:hypothetical protein
MRHIVVKISPNRWIVAERDGTVAHAFRVCTRTFHRAGDAHHVRHQLENIDCTAYSRLTEDSLLTAESD